MKRGKFVVVEGIDGIGKGLAEDVICDYEISRGRRIYNVSSVSKEQKRIPKPEEFIGIPGIIRRADFIRTAEPGYAWTGASIREEIVSKNSGKYTFEEEIDAFSLDRAVNMKRIVIPALENGLDVIQSRCVASTFCYQGVRALEGNFDGDSSVKSRILANVRNKIIQKSGTAIQMEHRPDLLIILTTESISELMERIESRKNEKKDDNAIFEDYGFQEKLKPFYEDSWLRKYFESFGSKVAYLDAGISRDSTKEQVVEVYSYFMEHGEVKEQYRNP